MTAQKLSSHEARVPSRLSENLLVEQGVSARHTHRLYRQVRRLVMVAITSLRLAHYELWRDISPQPDDDNPDNRDDGDDDGDTSDPS